jgi:hypothetical protein
MVKMHCFFMLWRLCFFFFILFVYDKKVVHLHASFELFVLFQENNHQ